MRLCLLCQPLIIFAKRLEPPSMGFITTQSYFYFIYLFMDLVGEEGVTFQCYFSLHMWRESELLQMQRIAQFPGLNTKLLVTSRWGHQAFQLWQIKRCQEAPRLVGISGIRWVPAICCGVWYGLFSQNIESKICFGFLLLISWWRVGGYVSICGTISVFVFVYLWEH